MENEKQFNIQKPKVSTLERIYEKEEEINLFYYWLFERDKKFFRDLIYKYFPELTDIHENKDNLSKEELLSKIEVEVTRFREKYADNIKLAEENIQSQLEETKEGIKELETLMNEDEHYNYLVMPNVYPINPYDESRNLFYFSIVRVADGSVNFDDLSSSTLHEISHFIFFRQLEKIKHSLSERAVHHLKEVLTPVILQNEIILSHRKFKKIRGNWDSTEYKIEEDGEVMKIYDYVNNEYNKNPTPEGYMPFLNWLIKLFEKIDSEVCKKDELSAKNGMAIFQENTELNKEFMKPIKI